MCCVLLSLPVSPHAIHDPDSLDSFIRDFASSTRKRRTGRLYEVVLPANFSGIEASIVTLKSGSLWTRGANFSLFEIPPRALPWPYVRRLEIVYENLGNWSSSYFVNPPNHTLISPVMGLIAYEANGTNGSSGKIELNVIKDPITLHFPHISFPNPSAVKCVGFQSNGTVEFSNLSRKRTCSVRGIGHFSLAIPTPTPPEKQQKKKKKKSSAWKWGVIIGSSIVLGIVGLVLLIGFTYKGVKGKRLGKMERQSEKSESLDCVWVGSSKMPCATSIRTQPALENAYVP
ncbi:PREDICTED: uncharacterized protein LOC109188618 [Ipomoea nil]|uniref:uncharacterized protein LOC109188618 n=1 Tax=Ipomoea nil TaxID=35883 RepID=UPI000900E015|nr:PREDICTED: uncharacterized protein LOC109188618 [Ipomoea nil]